MPTTCGDCQYSIQQWKLGFAHIFGRSRLKVDSPVEKLVQYGDNSIFFVQRLQTREEPQQKLEGPPIASVQSLLTHWPCAIEDLLCNIPFLAIGVKHSACDEGYLQWLFDDPTTYQYPELHASCSFHAYSFMATVPKVSRTYSSSQLSAASFATWTAFSLTSLGGRPFTSSAISSKLRLILVPGGASGRWRGLR